MTKHHKKTVEKQPSGAVWAIVNLKGGAGKTTTATCLAACALADKRRVAILDADAQQSVRRHSDGLIGLRFATSPRIDSGELLLVDFAPGFDRDGVSGTEAALACADVVIIPAPTTEAVEEDTIQTCELARECGVPVIVVVPTMFGGTPACRVARRRLQRQLGNVVSQTTIPHALRHFRNAASAGQTVITHAPESKAAQAYRRLYAELSAMLTSETLS